MTRLIKSLMLLVVFALVFPLLISKKSIEQKSSIEGDRPSEYGDTSYEQRVVEVAESKRNESDLSGSKRLKDGLEKTDADVHECKVCSENTKKLLTQITSIQEKAEEERKKSELKSCIAFCIASVGIFILLALKLKKAELDGGGFKRNIEYTIVSLEAILAIAIILLTHPALA